MVNFGQLTAEISWRVGHPSKFEQVSRLGFVTAATSLTGGPPNLAPCLAVSCACTIYIHFRGGGLLLPGGILPGAKFTWRPSLAFSYIGSVTAWHSFFEQRTAARQRATRNVITGTFAEGATYIWLGGITLGIGPHSSLLIFPLLQF